MDYYEELGIEPTATDDEIRRAHHRMVKLFHPDQQTNDDLKSLAETQLRRVNSIVEILYDPERRRLYDQQLREDATSDGTNERPQHRFRRNLPWWTASTAAAIALTLAAVWFWADHWGSSFGNRAPTYIASEASAESPAAKPAAAPTPPPADVPSAPLASAPVTVDIAPSPASRTIAAVPTSRHSAKPPRAAKSAPKRLKFVNANVSARVRAAAPVLPPPPNVPASAPRADPAGIPVATIPDVAPNFSEPAKTGKTARSKTRPANPLEGEWVYAPTSPEKRKAGFYPPEFIDLKLFATGNGLHGQYHARYHVVDRPIPPDVEFTLAPDGTNKFLWTSSNGSKGTLKVSGMDPTSIRIEWRTTVFSNSPALTAGTATLVRRAQ